MIQAGAILTPHPDVIHTKLVSGEVVLLHLKTEQYFSLNETGSQIWELLDNRLSLEQIAEEVQNQFEVTAGQALKSVAELAEQLVAQGLVKLENGGKSEGSEQASS